ncbi:MAG: homocysteine S-methyltransferase family protein [Clostridium sp.]|nr:homocysteine S-methyltransferase family protein [Clostridium sp.]
MDIKDILNKEIILFDGAMGTMLQQNGLKLGQNPEVLNFTNEDIIKNIYRDYIEAGAKVITLNTFGANELKLDRTGYSVEEVFKKAMQIAKEVKKKDIFVAADIGPIGELLEPMGTLSFDKAYEIFKRQVMAAETFGADLILIETMTDLYESKAAILAAKENTNLPIFCTMSFQADGRTFTGCTPGSMAITLEGLGVDALGVNCSLGPKEILSIIKEIKKYTNIPLMVQPNAGLPSISFGEVSYDIGINEYVEGIVEILNEGVAVIGGCCGTMPAYIKKIHSKIRNRQIAKRPKIKKSLICSSSKVIEINEVRVIGERINPTGKKLFKEALKNDDLDYILKQGIEQVEAGAEILDVNVGLPEINEAKWMKKAIVELQGILDVPLQIDSTDREAVEVGLRYYKGKPILNSVNGEEEVLDSILPLAKKYGAAVVGLTLDKRGIPNSAEERVKIAEKILNKSLQYGIKKEDLFIDTLVLPISSDGKSAKETLKALELVKERLGLKTLLGISNISFGLPNRELLNRNFLALALSKGLDLPIVNPNISGIMETIYAYNMIYDIDKQGKIYIEKYGNMQNIARKNTMSSRKYSLGDIIEKGLKSDAEIKTAELLKEMEPLLIVNNIIIPALKSVGDKFEKEIIFLPQLIASAETVQKSFSIIKEALMQNNKKEVIKGKVILATVEGDIHDIGKNIVKVILESYGFKVIDLGKDVPAEEVLRVAREQKITLVGLSALMTITVKSMEKTIKLIKENTLDIKIMVGGAILTKEYAKNIGADFYAKDAMESVKIAEKHFSK